VPDTVPWACIQGSKPSALPGPVLRGGLCLTVSRQRVKSSASLLRVRRRGSRLVGMGTPETRYARSGDVMVAYQVLGEGPFDVVFAPGFVSHVEVQWEAAGLAALLRGIAEHARLIVFRQAGHGPVGPHRGRADTGGAKR
jgi:hypothetical protein